MWAIRHHDEVRVGIGGGLSAGCDLVVFHFCRIRLLGRSVRVVVALVSSDWGVGPCDCAALGTS